MAVHNALHLLAAKDAHKVSINQGRFALHAMNIALYALAQMNVLNANLIMSGIVLMHYVI